MPRPPRGAFASGGEALAARITRRFEGGAGQAGGLTLEEARRFEEAGEVAARAAEEVVEKVPSFGGRRVAVTPSGLWSCASPCMMVRERYATTLARPDAKALLDELDDLEKLAKNATPEMRKQLAHQGAELERKIEALVEASEWTSPLAQRADFE